MEVIKLAVSKPKHDINLLLYSLIIATLFGFISWIISKSFEKQFTDILFYVSLGVIIIGLFLMMRRNTSEASLLGLDKNNVQYIANETLEDVKQQQQSTDYHKNFKKHSVEELNFKGIAILLSGVLLMMLNVSLT
ncbi:hypothetical protein CPAL_18310 [Clostridium thermopalmarium DSM 5974]|uniref:DUF3899 domain-containing protein n=2 Tax=Clostridium TaxID=1485 RepID=A0A151APD2_9CLOT|nr:hypothetical protein [Clostridium thermopalmarium]KYH29494.1 hypothetical protein CLCOL_07250 [Clostridium colicanis DSM 13634]PRR70747.1 hypothetical protein CPAL_18310 [Clostridium thermopalmarium DSM 5974]PVZ22571.1 hypothetical protein LX19_01840 [Clostridium thermopalmarium DSM 5974]